MADPTDGLDAADPNLWYKLQKPGSLAHNNIEDAAAAAEYHFQKYSDLKNREHAAIIYRDTRDGKIYHTPLVSSGANNTVHLDNMWNSLPKEFQPLALMHNHPADPPDYPGIERNLSDADTNLGKTKNLRMFLIPPGESMAEGTGRMRKVSFQDKATKQYYSHEFQKTEPTLAPIPIDEIKRYVNGRARQDYGMNVGNTPTQPLDPDAQLRNFPWNEYKQYVTSTYRVPDSGKP